MLWAAVVLASAQAEPPPLFDAHSHYTAADARQWDAAAIMEWLDAAGVSHAAISGTPWPLARDLHAHAPTRIIPLLGVYESEADKARWMHDPTLPSRVAALLASGHWAGIGELHLFARDAGSDVFAALVRLAERHGLMLLLHGDEQIVDRAFEVAPDVRVLWAHLGTVPEPDVMTRVLQRHAERALWIDTSVRDDRIAPGGRLRPEWRHVFETHPERFVVAIDAFSPRRWERYGEIAHHIRQWTGDLPPAIQDRLLRRNAEDLFGPWLSRQRQNQRRQKLAII